MFVDFNSIISGVGSAVGSFFSGVLHVTIWLLALQGLVLGLMVLFYGRRSFWVFASVFGFVFGLWIARNLGAGLPVWAQPVLAVVLGAAGAALAYKAPRLIAAFMGGLALALLGLALLGNSSLAQWLHWLIAIAAAVLGFYVFWRMLDWALIVATSLIGAGLASISLTGLFGFTRGFGVLPFVLLLIVGTVYQRRDQLMAGELKRSRLQPVPVSAEITPSAPAALPAQSASSAGQAAQTVAAGELPAEGITAVDPAA